MSEKEIVSKILRYLKTVPKCFAWKEHGGIYGTAGIPDIVACIDGKFYAFEVKTPVGKTTKLQEATIRKILACGGTASVVRSVDEVRAVKQLPAMIMKTTHPCFTYTMLTMRHCFFKK